MNTKKSKIERSELLVALLGARGRDNAVTGQQLEIELLGRPTRRQLGLRAAIRRLIDDGHAIGSHPSVGYFMIDDDADLSMATAHLATRINSMAQRMIRIVENAR